MHKREKYFSPLNVQNPSLGRIMLPRGIDPDCQFPITDLRAELGRSREAMFTPAIYLCAYE
jgi:hypothetical protein